MISKEEALKALLNEKEIKVYLSLLFLNQSTATSIAKKSKLNRVTTYDILNSLLEKGFVSYVIISGVKHFEAVEPTRFLDDLKEKQEKISQIMPELNLLKNTSLKKPIVEFYQGINGLKSIFNDILKENKDAWFIGAPKMLEELKFYFPHFINQKRKQRIFSKVISYDCKSMRQYDVSKKYVELKLIKHKLDVTKILYANKVAFLTFNKNESIGVIIKDKDILKTEKKLFDIIWSVI